MTFGSGGGSPKTISMLTDIAPVVNSFTNRDFYTCPLDTLAIVTPILFSYGTGSIGDPDVFNFAGISLKQTDPITGAIIRYLTQYSAIGGAPFTPSPNYGRIFLHPNAPDAMNGAGQGPYVQRYEKFIGFSNTNNAGGGSAPNVITKEGYGGGIILFPGETLSWGASDSYGPNAPQWRLRYGLLEYGIAS